NYERQNSLVARVIDAMEGNVVDKKIAVLGVAFKPNTDDIREAPALVLIPQLQAAGAKICAYDPIAMNNAAQVLKQIEWVEDVYEAAKDADALVIMTEWNEFRELDLIKAKSLLKSPKIVDCRNIFDPKEIKALGFEYDAVGRIIK
ncbi:MAG TPA: UDP binding domain-containing protein, partial [bacterium]|nr:UDP binding domain-containing protein [bacterium]